MANAFVPQNKLKFIGVVLTFVAGYFAPAEIWAAASFPMLVVIGILSAAMFTRSGARSQSDGVIATQDKITAEDQAQKIEQIQDYLAKGVKLALIIAGLIIMRPAFSGKGNIPEKMLEAIASKELELPQIETFISFVPNVYQGLVLALFLSILLCALNVLKLDRVLLQLQHENIRAVMDKQVRDHRSTQERQDMAEQLPPSSVDNFGRIVENPSKSNH